MNTFDEIEEPVVLSPDARKRRRTRESHKRAKVKEMRHSKLAMYRSGSAQKHPDA